MNFKERIKANREKVNQRGEDLKRLDQFKDHLDDFVKSGNSAMKFGSGIFQFLTAIRDKGVTETDYSKINKYAKELNELKDFVSKDLSEDNAEAVLLELFPNSNIKHLLTKNYLRALKIEKGWLEDSVDAYSHPLYRFNIDLKNFIKDSGLASVKIDNFSRSTTKSGSYAAAFSRFKDGLADYFFPPRSNDSATLSGAFHFDGVKDDGTLSYNFRDYDRYYRHSSNGFDSFEHNYNRAALNAMNLLIGHAKVREHNDSKEIYIEDIDLNVFVYQETSGRTTWTSQSTIFGKKSDHDNAQYWNNIESRFKTKLDRDLKTIKSQLKSLSEEVSILYHAVEKASLDQYSNEDIIVYIAQNWLNQKSAEAISKFLPKVEYEVTQTNCESNGPESSSKALVITTTEESDDSYSEMTLFEKLAYIRLEKIHDGNTNPEFSFGRVVIEAMKNGISTDLNVINEKFETLMEFSGIKIEDAPDAVSKMNQEETSVGQAILEKMSSFIGSFTNEAPEEAETSDPQEDSEEESTDSQKDLEEESTGFFNSISSFFFGSKTTEESSESKSLETSETASADDKAAPTDDKAAPTDDKAAPTDDKAAEGYVKFDKEAFDSNLNTNMAYISESLYGAQKVNCFLAAGQFVTDATGCQVVNAGSDKKLDYCQSFEIAAQIAEEVCLELYIHDTNRDEMIITLLESLSDVEMNLSSGELSSTHAEGRGLSEIKEATSLLALPHNQPKMSIDDMRELDGDHQGSDRSLIGSSENQLLLSDSDAEF